MESLKRKLEISRLELLDMGLRGNTLLHFRSSTTSLEVVDEHAVEIFRVLVSELKAMTFIPIPKELVDKNDKPEHHSLLDDLEVMYGDGRHTDTRLQTKLSADALDKKLLKISTEAESYYQEQGVDILYLALGFLTWFEDPNSDKPRKAPLILVPVSLVRGNAKENYKVIYTQADLSSNLTLSAKLKMDFQVSLPPFGDDFDVNSYIDDVIQCIKNQPRWCVNTDEIALGFFSFGKFQMYQDLDPDNWPEDKKPHKHKVFQHLLGKGFCDSENNLPPSRNVSSSSLDQDLTKLNFVKDADSSQTEAVIAVKQGHNLVIQGPPGTGKSQTITNIIAESLADGKTVLFVAEKMAALEVVKRRLDESYLGDAVLELHSHKSNKRAVLDELKRTLELGSPVLEDRTNEKLRHANLREQLDAYCAQVNTPILTSETTYIDALGCQLKLQQEADGFVLPELDFSTFRHWDNNAFLAACGHVREMVEHLKVMGIPSHNPFSLSTLDYFSPVEQNHVINHLIQAQKLLAEFRTLGDQFSAEMLLKTPETITEIDSICRAAKRALDAPHVKGLKLTTDDWQQRRDQIKDLIDAGIEMTDIQAQHGDKFIDQAWQADMLKTRQVWATTGRKWWRFMSGEFRQAKQHLQGVLKAELPSSVQDCVLMLDGILKYQTLNQQYNNYERLGESLFGAQWQGKRSEWSVLKTINSWVIEVYQDVGKGDIPEGLLKFIEGGSELSGWESRLGHLNASAEKFVALIDNITTRLSAQLPEVEELETYPLDKLDALLSCWINQIDSLYLMTRYNNLRKKLCTNELSEIDQLSYTWDLPAELLLVTLKKSWYEGLVNQAYRQNQALKFFDRVSHENIINEFKRLDHELFHYAQEALVLKHYQRLPTINAAGEMAIIRREMNKKQRHIPIRRLIVEAGHAIQQIKPVFMMSPMSVATYLTQGAIEFDLVVFDEASQVKVVDAIGPILRGKQVVVVGDTRQMPPTDFFGKALELDDEDAEESNTADIESILSMFLSQGAPETMLKWHYRSRHDSLISVSNQEFYDGRLMIFPSPGINPHAKGLKFNHLPHSVYERGGSRTNPIEARAVADAVFDHVKKHPNQTLGVVAFSTAQRDCILLEVERLRREDPSCESFFSTNEQEGFFVKNLENVQGDERDVIFISIGYGRTATGNVTKSFGPLNRDGGERRLNVLITRARLAMTVFCNFTADDMNTQNDSPFGVRSLKNFLHFAQTGELNNRHETGKDTDSPFEDEVISAIKKLGYEVEPQVGSAGFYIDIGVKDPKKPGRYILAVECDGASYHSSANARDRDRLRQGVLEGLGWRFHRIWSTDWFRNAYKETERLKDAIEQSIYFYSELEENNKLKVAPVKDTAPKIQSKRIERNQLTEADSFNIDAYIIADGNLGIPLLIDIHELPLELVAKAIRKVIDIEGPVHTKEVAKRIAETAGFSKVGSRMLGHIEQAAQYGYRNGFIHVENDFLFSDSSKPVKIRDRSNLPSTAKKIELVPKEEISEALIVAITSGFSLSEDEAISEALSMMGFQRSTAKAKDYVNTVLDQLIYNNILRNDNNKLSLFQ